MSIHTTFSAAALLLAASSGLLQAEAQAFTGTYDWIGKSADSYGDKTLTLTLTPEGEGYRADFSAHFFWANKKKQAKDYSYSGLLTGDPDKLLEGKVYDASEKRYWTVAMRATKDGWQGQAKEHEGYKTKGTFAVQPKPTAD